MAILGPSGCGKTTLLNIIGGLDRYTYGDLIINGTSTKDFSEKDWDAYRNHSIGFVFQSYNLINHLSVLDNVELGMTLSGVSQSERRKRALEVLERVGLKTQVNKRPTKLSGGEKQRVAIARALVNDPDIILADEPTGALDSKTAHEILQLIKEISNDKLVIMVTHARVYAEEYSSRIVELLDGEITNDTKTEMEKEKQGGYKPKRISMSFFTALKLSFNNLRTKKFRTIVTALASSVGIIGVGLVLSISNGFNDQIRELESDQLVGLPILIGREQLEIGFDRAGASAPKPDDYVDGEVYVYDPSDDVHQNVFSTEFLTYLEDMDEELYTNIQYEYGYNPILLHEVDDNVELLDVGQVSFSSFIVPTESLSEYYQLKAGNLPTSTSEVVLLVDEFNVVDIDVMNALGYDDLASVPFEDIIGKNLYVALNDSFYFEQGSIFSQNFTDLETVKDEGLELTIVGIVEASEDTIEFNRYGVKYINELKDEVIALNVESDICETQAESSTNIFDLSELSDAEKEGILSFLGCNDETPYVIAIYTDSVEDKETLKEYIQAYNEDKELDDKIFETDLAEAIGDTLGTLITSISVVLTAFASISLVVSSVMIGVIIYISVLERTKEIGIIRSLGGRKKDISRVFNAESVLIGFFAGLLGIAITYVLTFPINAVAVTFDESLANVAQVNILHFVVLVVISTVLTFIGGFIPSRIAAKKNPVEALRVE